MLIFNKFWRALYQRVHAQSRLRRLRCFSMLQSTLCFFIRTLRQVLLNKLKIISDPSLLAPAVIQKKLVY